LIEANAHVVPTLNSAATTGSFVSKSTPLVMTFRHLVKHTSADVPDSIATVAQQVDDSRESEAGAGAFSSLVENVQLGGPLDFVSEPDQRGLVGEVPKIRGIGDGREFVFADRSDF
jgi:hypothetical protein